MREIIRGRLLEEQRVMQQAGAGPITRWRLADLIHLGEQCSATIHDQLGITVENALFQTLFRDMKRSMFF